MIKFIQKGNFNNTEAFFSRVQKIQIRAAMQKYGELGVKALASATPNGSGKTAEAWSYEIQSSGGSYALYFLNNNTNKGVNIAVILQYGHGTGTGGYVQGRDFINPAIRPIFDSMVDDIWKEVTG